MRFGTSFLLIGAISSFSVATYHDNLYERDILYGRDNLYERNGLYERDDLLEDLISRDQLEDLYTRDEVKVIYARDLPIHKMIEKRAPVHSSIMVMTFYQKLTG